MRRAARAVFRWFLGIFISLVCIGIGWFLKVYLEVEWLPGFAVIGVTVLITTILWSAVMVWSGLGLGIYPRTIYLGPFWTILTFQDMLPVGLTLAALTLVYLVWIVEKYADR